MERIDSARCDLADDLEQILAADSDGLVDLSPVTVRWLLAALDELDLAPGEVVLR